MQREPVLGGFAVGAVSSYTLVPCSLERCVPLRRTHGQFLCSAGGACSSYTMTALQWEWLLLHRGVFALGAVSGRAIRAGGGSLSTLRFYQRSDYWSWVVQQWLSSWALASSTGCVSGGDILGRQVGGQYTRASAATPDPLGP